MWRRIVGIVGLLLASLILPVAGGTLGVLEAADDVYPAQPAGLPEPPRAAPPRFDPDRPTVAIALGPDGANVADALAPYEVFADTGKFNVVTVAPTSDPVTLTGGLEVVPDLTFAQLADRLPDPPSVIVVPQIHGSTTELIRWLRLQQHRGAPLVLSVCVGAQVLADAGLLDGRPATSHWLKLIGLRRSDPDVRWTDGVRFVADGDILTTAGVLSGIDGALHVLERLIGPELAERTAARLRWNGYRPGGPVTISPQRPAAGDLVALLSAAYRWSRPTTGVLLTDGVGEIELAAAFRPYTELSYLARLEAVSADGRTIRSRHGLTFLPRSDLRSAAPRLDRVLLPGTAADDRAAATLQEEGLQAVALRRGEEFPFDGALRDIAATYDVATARWVAKSLEYAAPAGELDGAGWPWLLTAVPILLATVGVGATVLVRGRLQWRRSATTAAGTQ